jgi:peptide/nickel transport system substrate-binding protein
MGLENRTLRTLGATIILAALAVMGVAQAGADPAEGPSEINAPETTTTTLPADADETTTTAAPAPFVYRVGVLAGVSTDNFWAFYGQQPSVWNSYILGPTKPSLFTAGTVVGSLEPELAVAHGDVVEGDEGWVVDVELSDEMRWSDGNPITSTDLVFTFETVRRMELGGSWDEAFPETVASIEATNDHSIRIHFTERPRLAVWPHGVGTAPIMAAHIWEALVADISADDLYALPGDSDVGGGPLQVSTITEDLIVSTRNEGYPTADLPDVIQYQVFADESAAIEALVDDRIDYFLSPKGLPGELIEVLEGVPGVEILNSPGNNVRYLGFNLNRSPMSDPSFRTALALLVDRGHLAEAIAHAGAPAGAMIPSANAQWFDAETAAENASRYSGELGERLARAVTVLEEAGYTWETRPALDDEGAPVAGEGLTVSGAAVPVLTILTPGDAYDPARAEYARAIADTLGILGIEARPVETDFDTVVDLAFTPDDAGDLHYDMYLLGWTLGNPALPGFYGALFSADGQLNNTGYASEGFEDAHADYLAASNVDEARRALWEMEAILSVDLPYLALYTSDIIEGYRSDRVQYSVESALGGLQARLGGIQDVKPAD